VNLLPLIERLNIIQKDGTVVRFGDVMNYAQREVIQSVEEQLRAGKPVRIIVLKARQIGISTVIEAIIFVLAMMQRNTRCLIVSHELDSAEHLLSMTTHYWNTFDLKALYTPKFVSQKRLAWRETNSGIQITTAKNVRSGRSRTIHVLHASEVAFWDDPDTLMTGLRQSIPNTSNSFIFVESTANGVGNYFATTWENAENDDNEFVPLFFPWHKHPEYTATAIGIPYDPLPTLTDPEAIAEEQNLRAMGIGNDRLAWRRWAIKNNCQNSVQTFHQEYPTTPEEAFISTGTNVFPLPKLRTVYDPMHGTKGRLTRETSGRVRFQEDSSGDLKIYKYPSDDLSYGVYMVGGDPTRTTHGDPACAQVINRRTWEQVAVLRIKIDPANFAEELAKLATYYNQGMIVPEIEGPGYATVGALLQMDYPYIWKNQWADKAPGKVAENYGWQTTQKRKHWAIGNLLRAVVDGDIIIHDNDTFGEMKNYVTMTSGEMGPAEASGHDDTVMALAIALTATITESATIPAYGSMVAQEKKSMVEIANDVMMGNDPTPGWQSWEHEDDGEDMTGEHYAHL
jgi:hypothetical protein